MRDSETEANCLVRYHRHTTVTDKGAADIDADLQFRNAADIALVTDGGDMVQAAVAAGHPTCGVKTAADLPGWEEQLAIRPRRLPPTSVNTTSYQTIHEYDPLEWDIREIEEEIER